MRPKNGPPKPDVVKFTPASDPVVELVQLAITGTASAESAAKILLRITALYMCFKLSPLLQLRGKAADSLSEIGIGVNDFALRCQHQADFRTA